MIDRLIYILFLSIIAIPVVVFGRQYKKVRSGTSSKLKGVVLFASYAMLPVAIYVSVHFAVVGLEELTDRPMIGEGFSRALVPAVGMGVVEVLLLTVVFAIAVQFIRPVSDAV